MLHKKLRVSALLMLGFAITGLRAQESINPAGGNASGIGGSVSYSVGLLAYQIHTGANGSVAEGVQQPYEISLVTAIEEAKGITLMVLAYPNPTGDNLTLIINEFDISNLSYQLYGMTGELLQNKKITGSQTCILMSSLVPATYFVKVFQSNSEIKAFKIVKN